MSRLGAPDVGLMSFAEVVDQAGRIANCVGIPVIADADTGYGGPLNVIRTVREFERAGVSAIQIEDQAWPKRCGHEPDRTLVSVAEMVGRIRAAADARTGDLLIVARTDARSSEGLEAAIARARSYADAGADLLFVESPESESEMEALNRELDRPTLANMVEGGRTPTVPVSRLAEFGYSVAIYPNSLTRMLGHQGGELLASLRDHGTTEQWRNRMLDHRELWDLFEYPLWLDVERRFQESAAP